MKFDFRKVKRVLGIAAENYGRDNVDKMSAALAYYTVFSMAPLLIIAVAIVGMVFHGEAATGQIFEQIGGFVGDQAATAIQNLVATVGQKHTTGVIATVVGVVTILFGAGGVFAEIQSSLNQIFQAPPAKESGIKVLIRHRFLSFAMVLGVGFLLIVSLILSALLAAVTKYAGQILPGTAALWQFANFAVSLTVVSSVFALMFKILPDKEMHWKNVWFGGILTAALFTVGKGLIGLYLGKTVAASYYGAAGSFALILLWVYYTAQILYIGAEVTQALATPLGAQPHVTST